MNDIQIPKKALLRPVEWFSANISASLNFLSYFTPEKYVGKVGKADFQNIRFV